MHCLSGLSTVCDVPAARHPLKRVSEIKFVEMYTDGILTLSLTKRQALVDFIACIPDNTARAVTRENILVGFRACGLIDENTHRFPDLEKILATCRTILTAAEFELCITSFPVLFSYQLEHGHVPDTKLEELGFPVDRDMDGTEVRRDATITQEARHCAKNLTHVHQVELRKERQEQIQAELTRKQADKQNKNSSQLAFNRKCEESLRALMSSEQTEISDSTLEHFFKCKKDELKGFIAARNGGTVPPSSLNKGTMQRATDGFDCLILRAFKYCSLPPMHPPMQEPEPPPGISEELTEEENTSEQEPQVANEHTIITASLTSRAFESRDLPSSLFSDLFITSVKKCFDSRIT